MLGRPRPCSDGADIPALQCTCLHPHTYTHSLVVARVIVLLTIQNSGLPNILNSHKISVR